MISEILVGTIPLSEIFAWIFTAGVILIGMGTLYKMFIKPFVDKKAGTLVEVANTKDFKCYYNKKNKKMKIKFKDGYSTNPKTALDALVKEFYKCDSTK